MFIMKLSLMRLSLVTIFGLILCSYAAPFPSHTIADIEALIERAYEIADRSEWVKLNARTGPFASTNAAQRQAAKDFISAHHNAVQDATVPSHNTQTFAFDNNFHLDRQQPTNQHGDHKVAIQLNHNNPSTIGQVVVNKHDHVSPNTVAAKLKHSVNIGQELRAPSSAKAARVLENNRKHQDKVNRNKSNYQAGMNRAKNGIFKKGNR